MVVSLGCHVVGAVNYWPDIRDPDSLLMGTMKRVATLMPSIDLQLLEEFKSYFITFMNKELKDCIIPLDEDLTIETWLKQTNYTETRKQQLRKAAVVHDVCQEKDFDVKEHTKHEPYLEPKHLRGIYARVDKFKTKIGPCCFYIGKKFFKLKWFIKTITMTARAKFIFERYSAAFIKLCSNDFSQFEATFVVLLMQIELLFYEFCLQLHKDNIELMTAFRKAKTGINRIFSKWFSFFLRAKRYSGEMDTSLMNSLMNLVIILFMLFKSGHTDEFMNEYPPTVEGDDSVFAHLYDLDETILLRLGAKAKLQHHDNLNQASFCKIVFTDKTMSIVTNPLDAMLNFGYTNLYYINASDRTFMKLLRAKSMSLIYTYPQCPILKHLALYGLRMTQHIDDNHLIPLMKNLDTVKKDWFMEVFRHRHNYVLNAPIDDETRLLVEYSFNIQVSVQLDIEKYLDSLKTVQPLRIPHLYSLVDEGRVEQYHRFGITAKYSTLK